MVLIVLCLLNVCFCSKFHKDQEFIPATNLKKENIKTATQNFISIYNAIQKV